MSPLWLTLILAAGSAPLDITTDSDCPSTVAIQAAVDALVTQGDDTTSPPLRVQIKRDDTGDPNAFVVELGWNGGTRTRRQRIAVGPDCGARAEAAAVAVASWLGTLPGSSAQPPPVETEPLPTPIASPPTTPPAVVAGPATPARAPFRTLLGVGVGIAAGGDIAPALRIEWAGARDETGLSWSVAAFGVGPRRVPLGPATSRWLRPGIELAGRGLWRVGSVFAMAQIGAVGTVTFAGGKGYPVDHSATATGVAATTALRLESATGTLRPWLELRALLWPGSQRLRYTDATTGQVSLAELPGSEIVATLGASFLL